MIYAVIGGAVCALIAAGLVRPFLDARHGARRQPTISAAAPRALLRQLRDLDDDLAAGRIADDDHERVRSVLEAQAVEALRERGAANDKPDHPLVRNATSHSTKTSAKVRWTRRAVSVSIVVLVAAGASAGLLHHVVQRGPLPAASDGASTAEPPPAAGGDASAAAAASGRLSQTALAELERAVTAVKSHPGRAAAHVELARAYAAAGQPQLAAVEYLATTKIDVDNVEANTALALVAFKAGNVRLADDMVTKALAAHPSYPEALYTRGLIRAMGLHHPAAATRDLKAYQEAAPLGSHRTTVATVLALLDSGAIK